MTGDGCPFPLFNNDPERTAPDLCSRLIYDMASLAETVLRTPRSVDGYLQRIVYAHAWSQIQIRGYFLPMPSLVRNSGIDAVVALVRWDCSGIG